MLTAFSFDEIDEEFVDWKLYERIEKLVTKLLNNQDGVKRKSEKKLLRTVQQDTFTGTEFVAAVQRIVGIKDTAEVINLGNMLLHYGYIYTADNNGSQLSIKNDGTIYKFQGSQFWPSQKSCASEEEYAIYLQKKQYLSKGKNGFNQTESIHFEKLYELLKRRWGHVIEKAEMQSMALREKRKAERNAIQREEESFWRVHRPPESAIDAFDIGFKRFCNRFSRKGLLTLSSIQTKVVYLKGNSQLSRIPSSVAINNMISHCQQYANVDVLLNKNIESASSSLWYKDFEPRTTLVTLLSLERWSISLIQLLSDKKGIESFSRFLKKEFSEENLNFWLCCEELKYTQKSKIRNTVIRIYRDFLAPGAKFEINVDNKAVLKIRESMKDPSMYAFDLAQDQIFKLMNMDSYPRFLKSEEYKDMMERAKAEERSFARKSNSRILNAARGLIYRSAPADRLSNANKEHRKLCRSNSDSKNDEMFSRSASKKNWFLRPMLASDRSISENDLSVLAELSNPGSPLSPKPFNSQMKLKGLPIWKFSCSVIPSGPFAINPCHSGPSSRINSPSASPAPSPSILRKTFDFRSDSEEKSKELPVNELNERLRKVQDERETVDDINDWHWQKVSHDLFETK